MALCVTHPSRIRRFSSPPSENRRYGAAGGMRRKWRQCDQLIGVGLLCRTYVESVVDGATREPEFGDEVEGGLIVFTIESNHLGN